MLPASGWIQSEMRRPFVAPAIGQRRSTSRMHTSTSPSIAASCASVGEASSTSTLFFYKHALLPFGLCLAPLIFTLVTKPLQAFLHTRGIRSIFYLDNILILGSSKEECLAHLTTALNLFSSVGFIVNHKKLCLVPAQRWDTVSDLTLINDVKRINLDARLKDGSGRVAPVPGSSDSPWTSDIRYPLSKQSLSYTFARVISSAISIRSTGRRGDSSR